MSHEASAEIAASAGRVATMSSLSLGALQIAAIAASSAVTPLAAETPATPFPRPAELAPAIAFWTRV